MILKAFGEDVVPPVKYGDKVRVEFTVEIIDVKEGIILENGDPIYQFEGTLPDGRHVYFMGEDIA